MVTDKWLTTRSTVVYAAVQSARPPTPTPHGHEGRLREELVDVIHTLELVRLTFQRLFLVILNFLDGASKLEDSVKDGGVFKYSTSECGSATKRRKRFDEFLATNNETESQREMSKMKIKRQVEVQQESSETRTSTTTTTVCKATSGPASGSECVFPFNYKGVSYTGCTLFEDTKPWCSTQTDANNNHVSGVDAWGYCDATCPKQGFQK